MLISLFDTYIAKDVVEADYAADCSSEEGSLLQPQSSLVRRVPSLRPAGPDPGESLLVPEFQKKNNRISATAESVTSAMRQPWARNIKFFLKKLNKATKKKKKTKRAVRCFESGMFIRMGENTAESTLQQHSSR